MAINGSICSHFFTFTLMTNGAFSQKISANYQVGIRSPSSFRVCNVSTYIIHILRVGCMIYIATMDTYACTCVVSFTDTNVRPTMTCVSIPLVLAWLMKPMSDMTQPHHTIGTHSCHGLGILLVSEGVRWYRLDIR